MLFRRLERLMPRTKRSAPKTDKTEAPQTSATPPEEQPEAPKCFACGRELTWRDRLYVVATAEQCKACHQRDWHKRLGIVGFHPAVTQVTQKNGKVVEVPVRFNRAARRKQPTPTPAVAPTHTRTRAERRAAARQRAARVTAAA
jgi:hypothetical protein